MTSRAAVCAGGGKGETVSDRLGKLVLLKGFH